MIDERPVRARALDPARSFIVQAPAGSGKTTLLTKRLLRLLTTVELPEQVVAVTFSRKAAEEMRARIVEVLELASGPEPVDAFIRESYTLAAAVLEHDRRLDWNLAAQPSRLRIMTIDALCLSLVRQMPVTAGMASARPGEEDARQLYTDAARDAVSSIAAGGASSKSIARALRHVDNDWGKLERLVAEMLARRDQWLRLITPGSDREILEASFARLIGVELRRAADVIPDDLMTALAAIGRFAGAHAARDKPESRVAALAGLKTAPPAELEHLASWQGFTELLLTRQGTWRKRIDKGIGFPSDARDCAARKAELARLIEALSRISEARRVLSAVARLPARAFSGEQWEICLALLGLLKAATAHLMVSNARSGKTDFVAIALAAIEALGASESPSELALRLDYRIQHLLVDEFQDTSVTQFRLIEGLTAGWTGEDGRSLFLVGDPMQSIYRFRQADVRLFKNVLESGSLGSVALEHLKLTENFRSQARLVKWVNEALPLALELLEAREIPFVRQRPVAAETGVPFKFHPFEEYDGQAETARVLEIVADIRATAPEASIAVLVRSRSHLAGITARLMESGFAVAAREIQPFAEIPIVGDLLALTRALLHLADRVAWFAILRAPWCGLTLASLHRVSLVDGMVFEAMHTDACEASLEPAERVRMVRTRGVMARALDAVGSMAFAELVECTWFALGGAACVECEEQFNDARAYFALLAQLERDDVVLTAERIELRIIELFSVAPGAHANAVEVMTVHRAKGLEFDYVIVPGVGRKPRADLKPLLLWREDVDYNGRSTLLMAPLPSGESGPLYDFLRERDAEETAAEAVRLLYVAVTRARHAVHMLGHVKRDRDGETQPTKGTFLELLWPVLERDYGAERALVAQVSETRGGRLAGEAVLRRLESHAAEPNLIMDFPAIDHLPAIVEFDWAGATAKHLGTVSHRLLQELASRDTADLSPSWMQTAKRFARGQLRALGVPGDELDDAVAQLGASLETTLSSERGRWLFSAAQRETAAELPLSAFDHGQAVHVIIDRTFVDVEGRRWIIDFKTGLHSGGSLDAFLNSEVLRYRAQLERYGRIMSAIDDRPIMLGLYFPLLDAWREWPYEP